VIVSLSYSGLARGWWNKTNTKIEKGQFNSGNMGGRGLLM
jgi:hypothetical protein